ncbi:MAG TPA: hypothetical protein VG797_08825 [Phycisphaerales bacterium]|nr:hypothetical protein [Phycisphaerales bacterium]
MSAEELVQDLKRDILAFFIDIGCKDPVDIRIGLSDARQQNAYVTLRGLEWHFVQEGETQHLYWTNPRFPEIPIGGHNIRYYFNPADDREIGRRASAAPGSNEDTTLLRIVSFIRSHFEEICQVLSDERIVEVAAVLRDVKVRTSEERTRLAKSRTPSP